MITKVDRKTQSWGHRVINWFLQNVSLLANVVTLTSFMLTTNEEFGDKEDRVRFRVEALEKELKQTRHSIDDSIKEAKVSKKKEKADKGDLITNKNSLENKKKYSCCGRVKNI